MRKRIEKIKKNLSKLQVLNKELKKIIILEFVKNLKINKNLILKANQKDLDNFDKNNALKDRLLLNENRFDALCDSLEQIAHLPDPIGQILDEWTNKIGLNIKKISIPLGIICIIYEARPAISAELIAMLLKSSNGGILKGGSEAKHTNIAIFNTILAVLKKYELDNCFLMLNHKDEIKELLKYDDIIDIVIPRGSSKMIKEISQNTKIPLIKHDKGLCHIFVDKSANILKAISIIINAKCQRPSTCNALETLILHEAIAQEFLEKIIKEFKNFKLKIHADQRSFDILKNQNYDNLILASEEDFNTEYLDYELNIKIVKNHLKAIEHINDFSSFHSDGIISNDINNIKDFQTFINSSCVFVNTSTRFNDGGEFGFGAEIGISTNKLHARGPVGLKELCTYKYIVSGDGQIRK